VHIAVRPKACPSCQPAYGPLIMLNPRPGRPPAKPAPPTLSRPLSNRGLGMSYGFIFRPLRRWLTRCDRKRVHLV
jgi:hypothetical protein